MKWKIKVFDQKRYSLQTVTTLEKVYNIDTEDILDTIKPIVKNIKPSLIEIWYTTHEVELYKNV